MLDPTGPQPIIEGNPMINITPIWNPLGIILKILLTILIIAFVSYMVRWWYFEMNKEAKK